MLEGLARIRDPLRVVLLLQIEVAHHAVFHRLTLQHSHIHVVRVLQVQAACPRQGRHRPQIPQLACNCTAKGLVLLRRQKSHLCGIPDGQKKRRHDGHDRERAGDVENCPLPIRQHDQQIEQGNLIFVRGSSISPGRRNAGALLKIGIVCLGCHQKLQKASTADPCILQTAPRPCRVTEPH